MTKLTFYGGVNEIGGNKILLEDKNTGVFFDFGQSFVFGQEYYANWLTPRPVNGLGDYFEFNLLPRIGGLYAKEKLATTSLRYVEPAFDAVFLTHAHFDHVAHIEFLDPKIPVHLGVGTKLFLECMEDTSNYCDYGEHICQQFRTGQKIDVGDITVEPVHVDHSIPAAYGFIIHTSKGAIAYTGDLRVHGPRKDLTEEFIQKATENEPIALIVEGTRMAPKETRQNYSEPEVQKHATEIIGSTDKVVFANRYSRDLDRFKSFYNATTKNHRTLVISPKSAHLLSKLQNDKHLNLPDPSKDDSIRVYYKRKKTGKYDDKDYFEWERKFLNKKITSQEIRKNQKGLVMDLDFYQLTELIDIRPRRGSHFIHSMSEPFSEEDIEDKIMHNWIKHFGLQFHQLHASGHMNRKQIVDLISKIKPNRIFPVHTENQDLFKMAFKNTQTIEPCKEYEI